MKQLIHPAYVEELCSQSWELQAAVGMEDVVVEPDKGFGLLGSRGIWARVLSTQSLSFLLGVGLGALALGSVSLLRRDDQAAHITPPVASLNTQQVEQVLVPTKLESDMELMKRIVAGLVESVQSLSQAQEVPTRSFEESEEFPFPVQVTADKAHLRKEAHRAAPSVLEVTRDTTLMAFGGTDKWFKVNTPRGEDGWISRSVVREKRG